MFPINQEQGENSLAAMQKNNIKSKFGKSFLFDFDKGDFVLLDGNVKVVEGKQALNVWIKKILKTEKLKYKIYEIIDNTYGVSLTEYMGSNAPTGYIYGGIQSQIVEALTVHPDITAVSNFEFTRDKRNLNVTFTIYTIYGETDEGVTL